MTDKIVEISIVENLQKDDEPKYLEEGDKVKFLFKGQMLTGEVVMRSGMCYAVAINDYVYTMERQALSFIEHKPKLELKLNPDFKKYRPTEEDREEEINEMKELIIGSEGDR